MFKNKWFWHIIVLAVLIFSSVILFIRIFARTPEWYAVHLTNGQVYFGQLKSVTPETITLKKTYFLEVFQTQPSQKLESENFKVESSPQQIYNLVKRSSRDTLMLTDDVFFINRSVVLFWEKLTPDSEVVKLIKKRGD